MLQVLSVGQSGAIDHIVIQIVMAQVDIFGGQQSYSDHTVPFDFPLYISIFVFGMESFKSGFSKLRPVGRHSPDSKDI